MVVSSLGQSIHLHDPAEAPDPLPNQTFFASADDPHWQCEAQNASWLYGKFHSWPTSCQQRHMMEMWVTTYDYSQTESNPNRINKAKGQPPTLKRSTDEEKARARALAATQKPDPNNNEAEAACVDSDLVVCTREKRGGPSMPDDSFDASVSGIEDRKLTKSEVKKIADDIQSILDNNPDCLSFIQGILDKAQSPTNPVVSQNPLDVLWAVFRRGGISSVPTKDGEMRSGYAAGKIAGDLNPARISVPPEVPFIGRPGITYSKRVIAGYKRTQELITASAVLNEVIHLSGEFAYNDMVMGIATAKYTGIQPPDYGSKIEDVRKWSNWWHPKVDAACSVSRTFAGESKTRR